MDSIGKQGLTMNAEAEVNDDTDIANDLSAAYDELVGEDDDGHEEIPSDVGGRAEDTDTDPPGGSTPADDPGVSGDSERSPPASEGSPTPDLDAPPKSLSPEAREAWKDTPASVKADIAKREADYAKGIEKYRDNAHRAEAMDHAIQPFQQYLAMQGQPPGQTLHSLLQTASALQMGSPVQKAQTVAQLINQFGVDIGTLDGLLAGEPVPRGTHDDVDGRIQQALQPFQQFIQQQEQQRQ